jgi:hypothetical protein
MTTNTSIEIVGINEAIRSLNKIEPGLRKQFNNDARVIAKPATDAVRDAYKFVPLSGMERKWAGPAVNGRKVFPFTIAKARRGVDVVFNTDRRSLGVINIVQRDAGTAIFETAGRKTPNPLGDSLGRLSPGRTRLIGPVVYSKARDIEENMRKLSLRIMNRVNRELNN